MVTDGVLANIVLGRRLGLDKALEPALSDELLSISGHHTMFSSGQQTSSHALAVHINNPRAPNFQKAPAVKIWGNLSLQVQGHSIGSSCAEGQHKPLVPEQSGGHL